MDGERKHHRRKVLTDENISPKVTEWLRHAGLDVLTVREAGLAGADDPTVLRLAFKEKRLLVTHDKGFRYWGQEFDHCGILICRSGRVFYQEIVRVCLSLNNSPAGKRHD
jgi:predicted nuclease of predicted toxin-antitoxin system